VKVLDLTRGFFSLTLELLSVEELLEGFLDYSGVVIESLLSPFFKKE